MEIKIPFDADVTSADAVAAATRSSGARLIVPLQALGGHPLDALDGLADDVLARL